MNLQNCYSVIGIQVLMITDQLYTQGVKCSVHKGAAVRSALNHY